MIRLIHARPQHCAPLSHRLRAVDVEECRALGREPKDALRYSLRTSLHAITVIEEATGSPIAMMGVVPMSLIGRQGCPWFLGSDRVASFARDLIVTGPCILDWWHRSFDVMENHVMQSNRPAIRLLKHWGAKFGPATEIGGRAFLPFRFERAIQGADPFP